MNVFACLNQLGIMRKQWHTEGWDLAKMIQLVSYKVKVLGIHAFHFNTSNCLFFHNPDNFFTKYFYNFCYGQQCTSPRLYFSKQILVKIPPKKVYFYFCEIHLSDLT